jgi:hypothetical protein
VARDGVWPSHSRDNFGQNYIITKTHQNKRELNDAKKFPASTNYVIAILGMTDTELSSRSNDVKTLIKNALCNTNVGCDKTGTTNKTKANAGVNPLFGTSCECNLKGNYKPSHV